MDIQQSTLLLAFFGAGFSIAAVVLLTLRLSQTTRALEVLAGAEVKRQAGQDLSYRGFGQRATESKTATDAHRESLFSPETLVDIQRMEEMLRGLTATLGLDPLASIRPQKPAPMENTIASEAEIPKRTTLSEGKTKGGMSPAVDPNRPPRPRPTPPPPSRRPRSETPPPFTSSNGHDVRPAPMADPGPPPYIARESTFGRAISEGFDCRDSTRPVVDEASGDGLAEVGPSALSGTEKAIEEGLDLLRADYARDMAEGGQFAHEDPVARAKRLIDDDIWDTKDQNRALDMRVQDLSQALGHMGRARDTLVRDIRSIIAGLPEHKEGSVIEHPVGTVVRCGRRAYLVVRREARNGFNKLSNVALEREGESDGE